MFEKIGKWALLALMIALIAVGAVAYFKVKAYEKKITDLQNAIAEKDVTLEVQKQIYAKLVIQMDDLKSAIDASTEEGKRLADEVKKNKGELLAVNNALIKLKEQVAKGTGTQTEVAGRKKVDFAQDFGYARVAGFTLTDPPEFELKLGQGSKPLKITTALEQLPDGSWKTLTSSSDQNVAVEIGVTAVNPYMLEAKWYEKVKLHLDLGIGSALLGGVGASYQVGEFDFGPTIWYTAVKDANQNYVGGAAFGLNFSWAPFKK